MEASSLAAAAISVRDHSSPYLAISPSRRRRRRLAVYDVVTERSRAQAYARSGSAAMCGGGTSESVNWDRRGVLRLSRRRCSRSAYSCTIKAFRDDDEEEEPPRK